MIIRQGARGCRPLGPEIRHYEEIGLVGPPRGPKAVYRRLDSSGTSGCLRDMPRQGL